MKYRALLIPFLFFAVMTQAQNVSNVAFTRVDKEVTVTYDLSKDANIRVAVSIDGGHYYGDYIQNLSGDVGKNIKAGKALFLKDHFQPKMNRKTSSDGNKVSAKCIHMYN